MSAEHLASEASQEYFLPFLPKYGVILPSCGHHKLPGSDGNKSRFLGEKVILRLFLTILRLRSYKKNGTIGVLA